MIHYIKDAENIATITLDMSGSSTNLMGYNFPELFMPVIDKLKEEYAQNKLKGVIISSAKKSFLAGGDLQYLFKEQEAKASYKFSKKIQALFSSLETLGVPVVAAINGTALGLGFELALACHCRVVVSDPKISLGHPEVQLGLTPCGGGTIRMMWLVGMEKTFKILTRSQSYTTKAAKKIGLVDILAEDRQDMNEKAREFIRKNPRIKRPWYNEKCEVPHGNMNSLEVAKRIRQLGADLFKRNQDHYPAQNAILSILIEASKVSFETGCDIESRYFTRLMTENQSQNLIQAFWYDKNKVIAGLRRPNGFGKFRPRKVGVIGAGVMGAGIAFNCAWKGIDVIVKDISVVVARKSVDYARKKLEQWVDIDKCTPDECTNILQRIKPTDKNEDFEGCDLVIEAVYENKILKNKVANDAEKYLDDYSIMATNTVSIPISELSKSSLRPKNYLGLHFFAPVESVPVVEIVKGEDTSLETIARGFDFVKRIGKIPLVVKDSWGFYSSRVENTYFLEGVQMILDGHSPILVENVGRLCGMRKGPLQLTDQKGLELVMEYENQAAKHYGSKYKQHPAVELLQKMIDAKRTGRGLPGFYNIDNSLWKDEEKSIFPDFKTHFDQQEMVDRFLFAQVIEALWCFKEKVIESMAEANLGSIHGWGFPPFKGGVMQFVKDRGGVKSFIERCDELELKYGPRFRVPDEIHTFFVEE